MMAAAAFQAPHWQLQEQEAKALAGALANVAQHYDIPALAPEYQAIGALIVVAFGIYAPRVVRSVTTPKAKPEREREEERASERAEPVNFLAAAGIH